MNIALIYKYCIEGSKVCLFISIPPPVTLLICATILLISITPPKISIAPPEISITPPELSITPPEINITPRQTSITPLAVHIQTDILIWICREYLDYTGPNGIS